MLSSSFPLVYSRLLYLWACFVLIIRVHTFCVKPVFISCQFPDLWGKYKLKHRLEQLLWKSAHINPLATYCEWIKECVICIGGWSIAEGENRENSQSTDLSPREHPERWGQRWGPAAGRRETARDQEAAEREPGWACRGAVSGLLGKQQGKRGALSSLSSEPNVVIIHYCKPTIHELPIV